MDKVGPILTSVGALIVAVGMLVVLLRAGALIEGLSEALGGKRKSEVPQEESTPENG